MGGTDGNLMNTNGDNAGGQGAILSDPHHTRGDIRMAWTAIRRRFPTTSKGRKRVVERLAEIVDTSTSEREVVGAAKAYIAADMVNIRLTLDEMKSSQPQTGVTVNVGVAVNTEKLVNDPQYLDFVRSRIADVENADAGGVRVDGEQRAVEVPASPASDRPGSNGHAHRSNGNGHPHS